MMGKSLLLLAAIGLMTASQIGCRACGSCYDYSSPLAGAACECCPSSGCTTCDECSSGSSYYEGEIIVSE